MENIRGKAKVEFDKAKDEELEKTMAEELHTAAMAYFNNGSGDQQAHAWQFFNTMDTNGDGRVSIQEYINFLSQTERLSWVPQETFHRLDRNKDGELDFEEIMTLYYVAKTRLICCRSCKKPQYGLYFTCVTCFDLPNTMTFDLCTKCYGAKYVHKIDKIQHTFFLDNYALLKYKRPVIQQQQYQQQYQQPHQQHHLQHHLQHQQHIYYHNHQHIVVQQRPWIAWGTALHAMEAALAVGNYLGFCNIM